MLIVLHLIVDNTVVAIPPMSGLTLHILMEAKKSRYMYVNESPVSRRRSTECLVCI